MGYRYPGFYLCYYLSTNINTKILLGPGLGQALRLGPGPGFCQAQALSGQAHNITKDKDKERTCVTIEGPPIPFSPFSVADCTMLSHFSFNDFITVAFPDLAGDLDIQI